MREEKVRQVVRDLMDESKGVAMSHMRKKLDELCQPDTSRIPDEGGGKTRYGEAGRTNPSWAADRHYERAAKAEGWTPRMRELRTPEKDLAFMRWLRGYVDGDFQSMREAQPEWARALDEGDTSAGGVLTPGAFSQIVFELDTQSNRLRNFMTVIGHGAQSVKVPRVHTDPIPAQHAEGANMTTGVTDPSIRGQTLTPVKLGQIIDASRELLEDSPLPTMSILARLVSMALGRLEDQKIIYGTPATDFTHSLEGTLTAHASLDWDDDGETLATLVTKLYELPLDVIPQSRWIIGTAAAEYLARTTIIDGTTSPATEGDRPLLQPYGDAPLAFGEGIGYGTLLGRPVHVFSTSTGSPQDGILADTAFVGDLSSCAIADRETLHVEVNRGAAFDTDQFALHVSRRVDFGVMQASHIMHFSPA